ncbi:hypothetical protein [Microtetraspora malaysiensis]|uniref:hypothetical protein n=1 Tax=Microtetraspora malaysiensis TaxID=161358 RepID=UPI0012F80B4E|nr:hypothetical protein [Microtetraspora malaysiensis]
MPEPPVEPLVETPPAKPMIESVPVADRPQRGDLMRPAQRGLLRRIGAWAKGALAWLRGRSDTESAA